jgi:hypothetical protein
MPPKRAREIFIGMSSGCAVGARVAAPRGIHSGLTLPGGYPAIMRAG